MIKKCFKLSLVDLKRNKWHDSVIIQNIIGLQQSGPIIMLYHDGFCISEASVAR